MKKTTTVSLNLELVPDQPFGPNSNFGHLEITTGREQTTRALRVTSFKWNLEEAAISAALLAIESLLKEHGPTHFVPDRPPHPDELAAARRAISKNRER